jgi:RNA polymerase sigma-70 factor (ECF subfamily)
MRRRKRQAIPVEHETLAALIGSGKSGAASEKLDPALLLALRDAMGQLSDSDQRIIYLRHCGELSFKQVAEMLEEPLGTVLARHHRALEKLRKLMGRLDKGPEGL